MDRNDPEDAWDACDRPDWLLWMGAAAGFPVPALLEAAAPAVASVIEPLPERARAPLDTILADALGAAEDLEDRLLALEHPDYARIQTYREHPPAGWTSACRACAGFARAYQALAAAAARAEAHEDLMGIERAGAVGVAPAIMTRPIPPLVVARGAPDNPVQAPLAEAVGLCAEALQQAAESLAAHQADDPNAMEAAEGQLSDAVHDALEAVRGDVLSGWVPR